MSTRSLIGRYNPDGTVTAIYCHFDGYTSGVGATLRTHYHEPAKVDALIALGSLSALGEEIGEAHDFDLRVWSLPDDDPRRRWTRAYGRDRGEPDTKADEHADVTAFLLAATDVANGYAYLFRDGAWGVYSPYIYGVSAAANLDPVFQHRPYYRDAIWRWAPLAGVCEITDDNDDGNDPGGVPEPGTVTVDAGVASLIAQVDLDIPTVGPAPTPGAATRAPGVGDAILPDPAG